MNELIEKLKDKNYVRAFGLMKPEEQECLRTAGFKNCMTYYQDTKWVNAKDDFEHTALTYAIKPDYQPEPELVDLEIVSLPCSDHGKQSILWLGVLSISASFLPHHFTHLHCLPSLPGFRGFWFGAEWVSYDRVAIKRDEGKTVYARFGRV